MPILKVNSSVGNRGLHPLRRVSKGIPFFRWDARRLQIALSFSPLLTDLPKGAERENRGENERVIERQEERGKWRKKKSV